MSNDLAASNSNSSGGMNFTAFVNTLGDSDPIKPNCKLCNSKFRKEAERLVETGASISSIKRMLDREGEDISYNAVANHINYHFKAKNAETDLKEYANQLEKWGQMSMSEEELIRRYIRMLDIEITFLGSKNAHVDMAERRKNEDMIVKMQNQVMMLKESAKKLNAELQPIEILFTSLNRIIEIKLKSSISPEAKKALQDVIDQLKKEVGEVPIEGKKQEE